MNINDIVNNFKTTPFLFIGSGLSRRYLGLPDWKNLLVYFSKRISGDDFVYQSYVNQAQSQECEMGIMPKIGELVQKDFDKEWFKNPSIRKLKKEELKYVSDGVSPFKVELASYLKSISRIDKEKEEEIKMFVRLSEKSISGIITTNYDTFLE